jgi:O-antigen ligase
MFLIPALTTLLTYIYLRPQEVYEALRPVTITWMLGLTAYAYVLDLRLGYTRPRGSQVQTALLALFCLAVVTIAIKSPDRFGEKMTVLVTSLFCFLFVSQGAQRLRSLAATAAVLLIMTLTMTGIGIQQGLSQSVCYQIGTSTEDASGEIEDGRPCASSDACLEGGAPGAEYRCERPGLLKTHTIGGRVRFRGLLEDPNELGMAISMGAPLAFAFYERRRGKGRLALLLATFALGFVCLIMTKSRSGQLSMLVVLGVYFLRRFGRRGAVAAAIAAIPLLLLGGRSGAEAESSATERLECWDEALQMWRENPFLGVGQGEFGEHHYLTAHNSFLLALAELGPLGLFLFTAVLYAALKIVIRIRADLAARDEARDARIWATALLASLAGMVVSAFFLSVTYHTIFWLFLGLPVALYSAVRAHDPNWRVHFGWKDAGLIAAFDAVMVVAIFFYLRIKGV